VASYIKNGRDGLVDWKYTATEDMVYVSPASSVPLPTCGFENKWLQIKAHPGGAVSVITRKDYSWDGPTLVRDTPATVWASGFHDPIYQFAKEIAAAWGWTEHQVLVWGDKVFRQAMMYKKETKIRTFCYYWGVRMFGRPAHWFMSLG
jgi:hypothetical protein